MAEPSAYKQFECGTADIVRINSGALEITGKFRLHVSLVRRWNLFGILPGIFPEIQAIRRDQQKVIGKAPDIVRKQVSPHLGRPVTRSSEPALDLGYRRNLPAPIKDS